MTPLVWNIYIHYSGGGRLYIRRSIIEPLLVSWAGDETLIRFGALTCYEDYNKNNEALEGAHNPIL